MCMKGFLEDITKHELLNFFKVLVDKKSEHKDALRSEKDEIIMTLTNKTEERDAAEIVMKLKRKELLGCKAVKTESRSDDSRTCEHSHTNKIESVTLKSCKITRYFYHGRDSQGNGIVRLMSKGLVVFDVIRRCLIDSIHDSIKEEEIDMHCNNFGRLTSLMDSVFSTLHSKGGKLVMEKLTYSNRI